MRCGQTLRNNRNRPRPAQAPQRPRRQRSRPALTGGDERRPSAGSEGLRRDEGHRWLSRTRGRLKSEAVEFSFDLAVSLRVFSSADGLAVSLNRANHEAASGKARRPSPHIFISQALIEASDPEERPELLPEQPARGEDRHAEEDHGPDSERGGDVTAFAHELEEFVNRLRDREVLLFLREDQRSDFQHQAERWAPASRFAAMSGSVMRRSARSGGQPRFCAASSSVTLVCCKPATAERTTYGSRRTE